MDLFDIDILEGQASKYETNHIHMIVDGNVALSLTFMCNKEYGTFLHEYIHYLQHFTTLYGVKICAIYNKMFNLYREHILKHSPIYLPLKLWTTDEKLSDFIAHKNKIEGSRTCSHNVDEVEVNNSDIEEARKNKTSVNIGIYDFENGKVEYKSFRLDIYVLSKVWLILFNHLLVKILTIQLFRIIQLNSFAEITVKE